MKKFDRIPIVVADSFGDPNDVLPNQWDLIPHLADHTFFKEHPAAPKTKPNPHGWMCFSKFWPLTLDPKTFKKFDFYLVRWLDAQTADAHWWLHRFCQDLLKTYGCLIWSNSWGSPRMYGTEASNYWFPWAKAVNRLAEQNPYCFVVFAAGNEGPMEAGWPQSFVENSLVAGSNKRSGKLSKFSCHSKKLSFVQAGEACAVANPESTGYTFASGTSFSAPGLASLCAYLLATKNLDRNDAVDFLIANSARPPEIKNKSAYWGFGDTEPLYQQIGAKFDAWKKLRYPGPLRQQMADLTSFLHCKTLPNPKTKFNDPVLPSF